jgi:hypothetical protein
MTRKFYWVTAGRYFIDANGNISYELTDSFDFNSLEEAEKFCRIYSLYNTLVINEATEDEDKSRHGTPIQEWWGGRKSCL